MTMSRSRAMTHSSIPACSSGPAHRETWPACPAAHVDGARRVLLQPVARELHRPGRISERRSEPDEEPLTWRSKSCSRRKGDEKVKKQFADVVKSIGDGMKK